MDKFGIWGGRKPGGWCHISTDDFQGFVGTREQAEVGCALFLKEHAQSMHPTKDVSYEVVPFDSDREPEAVESVPTLAQFKALSTVGEHASHDWFRKVRRTTLRVIHNRGWVRWSVDVTRQDINLVLSTAGHRALRRTPIGITVS